MALPDRFRESLAAAERILQIVTEEQANEKVTPSGWTRKHVIGHLLDSAVNNHLRFVHAALNFSYAGPDYDQKGWVATHGYDRMPWTRLVSLWSAHNELLAAAVDGIPDDKYYTPCTVGEDPPVTLGFLIEDYLRHLQHHLAQIDTKRSQ